MPAISYQIAPLAVLMATLLTIGLLSRSHEITAMRSCGISLYWTTSPFYFSRNGLAMVLFLFSSTVIPWPWRRPTRSNDTDREARHAESPSRRRSHGSVWGTDPVEHRHDRSGGAVLRNIRLYRLVRPFNWRKSRKPKSAVYSSQGWAFA